MTQVLRERLQERMRQREETLVMQQKVKTTIKSPSRLFNSYLFHLLTAHGLSANNSLLFSRLCSAEQKLCPTVGKKIEQRLETLNSFGTRFDRGVVKGSTTSPSGFMSRKIVKRLLIAL